MEEVSLSLLPNAGAVRISRPSPFARLSAPIPVAHEVAQPMQSFFIMHQVWALTPMLLLG